MSTLLLSYTELAKIAVTLAGKLPETGRPNNLSAIGDWSAGYVKAAEEMHLSLFTRSLDVHRPATRAAVVETLLEALNVSLVSSPTSFKDVPGTGLVEQAIATAEQLGLIHGDIGPQGLSLGTFRPNAPIRRAEVANIVSQILVKRSNGSLAPTAAVSSSAASSNTTTISSPSVAETFRRGGGGGNSGGGSTSSVASASESTSTTTSLVSSTNPTTYGQSTTLTATISDSHATGTVTFKDGSTTIGTCSLSSGSCSSGVSSLYTGS